MKDILKKHKLVGVLRASSAEKAVKAAYAAYKGGLRLIEVTFTVPDAETVIEQLKEELPGVILGAGSITRWDQMELAQKAGAEFFVSPHYDEELLKKACQKEMFYIPGGATPTELWMAHKNGAAAGKLFPGSLYGPSGLKSIMQPLPQLNLIVTGGVNRENALQFLESGALAVCAGSNLFSSKAIGLEKWDQIEELTRQWTELFQ